ELTLPPAPPSPHSWAKYFFKAGRMTKGPLKPPWPGVFVDLNSLIVPGIKLCWAFSSDAATNNKKPIAALINPRRHHGERSIDFLTCRVVIFFIFFFC